MKIGNECLLILIRERASIALFELLLQQKARSINSIENSRLSELGTLVQKVCTVR